MSNRWLQHSAGWYVNWEGECLGGTVQTGCFWEGGKLSKGMPGVKMSTVQETVPKMKCPGGELSRGSVWGKVKGNCAGCKMSGGQLSGRGNVWGKIAQEICLGNMSGGILGECPDPNAKCQVLTCSGNDL